MPHKFILCAVFVLSTWERRHPCRHHSGALFPSKEGWHHMGEAGLAHMMTGWSSLQHYIVSTGHGLPQGASFVCASRNDAIGAIGSADIPVGIAAAAPLRKQSASGRARQASPLQLRSNLNAIHANNRPRITSANHRHCALFPSKEGWQHMGEAGLAHMMTGWSSLPHYIVSPRVVDCCEALPLQ
jgi:hypothetical protein